jgi:ferrous iron transport protein A
MLRRLDSLGMRIGVEVRKVSAQLMRGPVTVQVGGTQLAIGFGMAQRILVEVRE